jgi:hypothetical protein
LTTAQFRSEHRDTAFDRCDPQMDMDAANQPAALAELEAMHRMKTAR